MKGREPRLKVVTGKQKWQSSVCCWMWMFKVPKPYWKSTKALSEKLYQKNRDSMAYFLGIDGGGSTIRVALIDEQENPVAHFKLHRNSNPTSTGFDYLKETLEQILHKLQPFACEITAIIINLAGVGASQQLIRTKQIVREVFDETKTVHVYHDAHGSLLANSPQEAAILVICGTGSAI